MARLTDAEQLTAYENALSNHRFDGYIVWTPVADQWVRKNLDGLSTSDVARRMYEYVVEQGGAVDRVEEKRPEWSSHDYHYDLRFPIDGRRVYIETRLSYEDPDDPDDPTILVANIHDV